MARRRISAFDQETKRLKKFEKSFFGFMWTMVFTIGAGVVLLVVKSIQAIARLVFRQKTNSSDEAAPEAASSPSVLESVDASAAPDDLYQPNPMWELVNIPVTNRKQAMTLAPQMLKQAKETAEILNGTANPETFFQRYDFLIGRLKIMKTCKQYGVTFTGEDPVITLAQLSRKSFRNKCGCHMIDRCFEKTNEKMASLKTAKGKQNAAERFNESFNPYWPCMSETMIQHQTHKYNELLSVVRGALASEGKESEAKMPQVPDFEQDPYLESWNNRKSPQLVNLEMPELPFTTRFDFSHVRGYDFGMAGNNIPILIEGKNRKTATEDILSLNFFLEQAHERNAEIPAFAFSADKIRFEPGDFSTDDYTTLSMLPLTKTGKVPKYPLKMTVRTLSHDEAWNMKLPDGPGGDEIFGDIYYLQSGEIGKATIFCWRHERTKEYASSVNHIFKIKTNQSGMYLEDSLSQNVETI